MPPPSAFAAVGVGAVLGAWLRWYLVGAGAIVASATVVESRRRRSRELLSMRWALGVLAWMVGVVATVAVPVVGAQQVPSRDAVLPLPPTMAVVREEEGCARPKPGGFGPRSCARRFTVAATDGANVRELARRMGEHLERTKGWPARWNDASTAQFPCRRIGWLNPYVLCVESRLDESTSTVEVQLAYHNGREHAVY